MKKNLSILLSYFVVAALSAATALLLSGRVPGASSTGKLGELENLISQRYIGEADPEELRDAAAEAMVLATGDRWSYYIPAGEYEAYQEQMANAYVGVGITILPQEAGGFLLMEVTEGGPAQEAGLLVDDLLVAVAGQDVRQLDTSGIRALVRGQEGTTVEMKVLRQGEELTFQVERRSVQTPVATWELLEGKVGLITIANFDARCFDETKTAIDTLLDQGAEKLIFDVRGNPGGYADELIQVLDYLLPEGEVFHTLDYRGREEREYSDAAAIQVPMVVLVDENSYSAAEFFAAALQEYEAAKIVGTKTVGKGNFQSTFRLSDGSAVALSIGHYFTPKGERLEGVGITPDVEVPLGSEEAATDLYYSRLAHEEDPQLQKALELLK